MVSVCTLAVGEALGPGAASVHEWVPYTGRTASGFVRTFFGRRAVVARLITIILVVTGLIQTAIPTKTIHTHLLVTVVV